LSKNGHKNYKAKKNICVFPIAWSSKLGSVGQDFFLLFFETYKYAPSSKITQTCLLLSFYSLSIIWHAEQCFWFQTSIKCTRKWRKFRQYHNSQASIVEVGNKHGNGDEFPEFADLFFLFGIKNVRVGGKILGSVDRKHTHFFFA
jgi:hypothetical protein